LLPRWDGCGSRGVCRCVVEVGRLSLVPGDGIEPFAVLIFLDIAYFKGGEEWRVMVRVGNGNAFPRQFLKNPSVGTEIFRQIFRSFR
jgi:hypothetical protein